MTRLARTLFRLAAVPPIGYALLLCWSKRWLPRPHGDFIATLRYSRKLKCRLSDRTQLTMSLGLFEPAETQLVADILGSGDTFIDVGAHIGWFSTLAARQVGPDGLVLACEPYPDNARALEANLDLNRISNVRIVGAAIGSKAGSLQLTGSESGAVTALNRAHGYSTQGRHIDVAVQTLDEVASGVEVVKLLKVDVEGWEPQVLRGAAQTLARTAHVLIEVNRPLLEFASSSQEEITGILRAAGFTSFAEVRQIGLRRLWPNPDVINILATR